jgi:hypothetical protein
MRFIVKCEVEANVILPGRLEIRNDGRIFELEVDSENRWNILRVTAPVQFTKRFKWGAEPLPEPNAAQAAPYNLRNDFDEELFDSIIADIQALESTLALFFPIRKINWRHPFLNVEFEPGDWRDPTWGNIWNLRVDRGMPPPTIVEESSFVQVASRGLSSHHLATIESFWREGENEMLSGRFINAFYNFFFVVEGLYGNGRYNDKLEAELKNSTELAGYILAYVASPQPNRLIEQIHGMISEQKKHELPTPSTLIRTLILIRNRLHHFSNDPKKQHGSPLIHDQYEGIATLVRFLAHKGLVKRALEVAGPGIRPAKG